MTLFVILVVIVILIAASSSSNQKKREEEERQQAQQAQKAETDVASALGYICRMLEALDILEDRIGSKDLAFYRHIGPSIKTHDSVFEVKCIIIDSHKIPSAQKDLDSIAREQALRTAAKNSGEPLPTRRGLDNFTVWCNLTDEQFDIVSDMITGLKRERNEDNDIVLKGELPLRFENPSGYDNYTRKANMYIMALTEAIHAKRPKYGLEANTYGITFDGKTGLVSYDGI